VIPLRDDTPTLRRPIVTIVLIVLNVAVFLLVQSPLRGTDVVEIDGGTVRIDSELRFNLEFAAIPCELVQGHPLTINEVARTFNQGDRSACDENDDSPPLFPGKNVYLAVVTSMFLHGGWLHLGFNMLFLWVFGNNIEDRLGRVMFLAFYLLAGVVATAGQVAIDPGSTVPVVGASGAIAGVMGAYLIWYPRARIFTLFFMILVWFREIEARVVLLVWFVLQFVFNRGGDVAWMAHVAGFAFGVAVAWFMRPRPKPAALPPDDWSHPPSQYR
jgi:membrane associated rhomboid family serine protease